jgi:hypothetical protein
MINRRTIANTVGCLSLILSLAFWLLLCLGSAKSHFARERFMQGLMPLFHVWEPVWALGPVLALAATVAGSKRWMFATLLPVVSFAISAVILASVPF